MGEIWLEDRDGVLLATISNPPHGLMDSEIVDALEALVAQVSAEDGPTGVVLTGAHPERSWPLRRRGAAGRGRDLAHRGAPGGSGLAPTVALCGACREAPRPSTVPSRRSLGGRAFR